MIYETPCKECEDGYVVHNWEKRKHYSDPFPLKPCPHCKGSGGFNLVVTVPSKHKGDTGYYRPLTVEEVEEMKAAYPTSFDLFIKGAKIPGFVYKGQPVKLMPREG